MESALPSRRSGLGDGAEHPAEAHAKPNASADCPARDHVVPDVGTNRPPRECHSYSTGAHTARDHTDSFTAHDLSYLTAPCQGGHCHEQGQTWLACALGQQACREGWTVLYLRLPRLLQEFPLATGDGCYVKLMTALAKTDVLILDDWGLAPLSDDNRRDLLELLEDRHDCRATIVTSQLPVEHWHEAIGEPTLADAILDRLVHNAYKIALKGDSMRKRQATLAKAPSV